MNTKRTLVAVVLAGFVALGATTAFAQSKDPLIGTWKLNGEKSTGGPKSGTSKIEAAGEGVKFTVDGVGADAAPAHWSFTAKFDGKDNPVTGKSPYGDTVALERIDAHTVRIVNKVGGKVTTTQTIVVAADGKTRINTSKGTNAKGEPVDSKAFYEKQ